MTIDKILPKLRSDLNFELIEDNQDELIVLIDTEGFAYQPLTIPYGLIPVLQMIDGKISAKDFARSIKDKSGEDIDPVILANIVNNISLMGFMETPEYFEFLKSMESYLESPTRPAVCAGRSYSDNAEELTRELGRLLNIIPKDGIESGATAIVVPHIDFMIGHDAHEAYASGYHALDGDADLFVIFGTSHFGNSGDFMLTRKDYQSPLGVIKTDNELIDKLESKLGEKLNFDDKAHRVEHSIEFQALLIQHKFAGRDIKILPVLTGSFQGYMSNGKSPADDSGRKEFIAALCDSIKELKRKVIYIASADLSHIGRKFNDDFDAEQELEQLHGEDMSLIKRIESCDFDGFYGQIAGNDDKRKICGLSPIYSLIQAVRPSRGVLLKYHQWNETETKSAVSFASLAYYK